MATVIISRSSEYMNRFRSIGIYIDGQKNIDINNGATETIEVAEGTHTINARIDWCGSKVLTFDVKEGEMLQFKLKGFKGGRQYFFAFYIMLFCIIANMFVNQEYLSYISFAIAIGLMVTLLYRFTIGRNTYLHLEQTHIS